MATKATTVPATVNMSIQVARGLSWLDGAVQRQAVHGAVVEVDRGTAARWYLLAFAVPVDREWPFTPEELAEQLPVAIAVLERQHNGPLTTAPPRVVKALVRLEELTRPTGPGRAA